MSELRTQPTLNLFPHQRQAVKFLRKRHGRAALFMKMRTGKTKPTVVYLSGTGARRILIVCPKAAVYVWRDEIKLIDSSAKVCIVADLSLEQAARKIRLASAVDDRVYLVINWEIFWRYPAQVKTDRKTGEEKRLPERGARKSILSYFRPDSLVWDEAQRLKGRWTQQSRFASHLEDRSETRRAIPLTGTYVTEGYADLFGIYRAFDKTVFGSAFGDFDRRYIVRGGYGGHQIKGYRNVAQIKRKLARTAYMHEGEPDDIEDVVVPVILGPKTRAAYEAMKKESLVQLEALDPDGKPLRGTALAQIVLTNILRRQQLTGGHITLETGAVAWVGEDKLKAALELTADALDKDERVVIFCRFSPEIERLRKALPHAGLIDGTTSAADRHLLSEELRTGKRRVIIAQIRAGGISLDLSGASVQIMYSYGYSLEDYVQARARLLGPKQKTSVTNYILQAERSIDETVYADILTKKTLAPRVMTLRKAKEILAK